MTPSPFRNVSENSSVLVGPSVPKDGVDDIKVWMRMMLRWRMRDSNTELSALLCLALLRGGDRCVIGVK